VTDLALLADHLAEIRQLGGHALVGLDDLVERVRNLARDAHPRQRQAHREVTFLQAGERREKRGHVQLVNRGCGHQRPSRFPPS